MRQHTISKSREQLERNNTSLTFKQTSNSRCNPVKLVPGNQY